jgi:hypothetical protein
MFIVIQSNTNPSGIKLQKPDSGANLQVEDELGNSQMQYRIANNHRKSGNRRWVRYRNTEFTKE